MLLYQQGMHIAINIIALAVIWI